MASSTNQDQANTSESIRNTLIVIVMFGIIAIISYFEWK